MDSSAASSQEKRVGTSTPEAELNPHRAKALLAKFKEEMALAKAATDPQEREKHSELVEKIKRILIRYQEQQKQAKNNSPATKSNLTNQDSTTNTPSPLATNNNSATNVIEPKTETPDSTPMEQKPIQAPTPQHPNNASTSSATMLTTQPQPQPQQQTVTVEKYNHVKNTLKDMWKQVKTLEASSINETQTKKEEIDRKITELRNQMQKYHTAALRMKSKLIEQGTIPANSTPIGSPTPVSNTDPTPIANITNTSNVTPLTEKAEENSKPNVKPPSTTTTTTSKSKPKPSSTTATNSTTKTSTPSKGSGSSKSNNRSSSQNTPGTSTSASASATKTASVSTEKDAPLTATTSTSAVAPAAATVAATTAPTAAAAATSLSTASAITTKSTADPKVTPSNIPDNDGRVLTKRKLVEMINNISIDQGDAKIPIDNDVEDIFLDLADEFVRNVVQFSGRLAKHRKLDRIDVRDVQLNLERNWGLRIPGYSTDEIRAARKWQPEGEYAENVKKISKLNKDQ